MKGASLAAVALVMPLLLVGQANAEEAQAGWYGLVQRGAVGLGAGICWEGICASGTRVTGILSFTPVGYTWVNHGTERAQLSLDLDGRLTFNTANPPEGLLDGGGGFRIRFEAAGLSLKTFALSYVADIGVDWRQLSSPDLPYLVLTPGLGLRFAYKCFFMLPYFQYGLLVRNIDGEMALPEWSLSIGALWNRHR